MRKLKKINGYLVVRFNERERREHAGTGIGGYGVIDAELYTGSFDIDRDAMEYVDADSLEVAMEQARGLEAEIDLADSAPVYTLLIETDDLVLEDEIAPRHMIAGWEGQLKQQISNRRYPEITPDTARHELYGYKMAMKQLGLIDGEDCFVLPTVFESEAEEPAPAAGKPMHIRRQHKVRGNHSLPGKQDPSPHAPIMTGLELLRSPNITADAIASIVFEHCPPEIPMSCDHNSCRECWQSWLETGEPPKEKGPSDRQTAPEEEGLHPNFAEFLRKQRQLQREEVPHEG